MEDLSARTSELKELLFSLTEYKDKENAILQYIETAEKLNYAVEDFPSDLDWFNTSKPLTNDLLQGKIVILDFFTYCCINCLHVIPHLRQLEDNFSVSDGLVVIGVHSAKFDNEKESQNILLALKRYNISHPVVNDKSCYMWSKLGISCWPTIVILGPRRQPLFVLIGEGHRDELLLFVSITLKFYKNSISPHELPIIQCDEIVTSTLFRFPGKISRWENVFAVSDSGNHRIIIFDGNTNYIKFTVGGTYPGFKDGSFETALFNSPQGLAFYDSNKLFIADTENHAIRLINLETLTVTTVVGNGKQGTDLEGGRLGTHQEISSPWDVCVVPCPEAEVSVQDRHPSFDKLPLPPLPPGSFAGANPPPPPLPGFISPTSRASGDLPLAPSDDSDSSSKVLLIAAAGTHQIWAYFIESCVWWKGRKYEKNVCAAVAGSGREENRNNRYPMMASFAQPSGLAYSKELQSVFIADSESSSVRRLSLTDGSVSHVVGGARSPSDLFSFGDVDGEGYEAKLQHPLAVVWSSKAKSLFVCDTYNHKVKRIDGGSRRCQTLHRGGGFFSEPGGGCLSESEDVLYVCDTNNNVLKTLRLSDGAVVELKIQERSETLVETPSEDVWEAETSLSKDGGDLALKIKFFPEEIHGKWSLQMNDSKMSPIRLKGKLTSNALEFLFGFDPSSLDNLLEILFDLVLCGTEICSFKKLTLRLSVRRTETGRTSTLCELTRTLD